MKTNKKQVTILFCVILALFIFLIRGWMQHVVANANQIPVHAIDLSKISDGDYTGEYSISPVYVKVKLTITENQITDIDILEHANGLGTPAEAIVKDIIEYQTLKVDAVSHATVSSKCIIKAIEDALRKEH